MIKGLLVGSFPILYKHYNKLKYKWWSSIDESKYPYKLAKIYKKKTGYDLDWNNLQTYNEKMQWAKLYENNSLKTRLTDKYLVREWVSEVIGEECLIPLLGVWNSIDEIDFDKLPNQFVLKTNHGSGTNMIIKDKNKLDKKVAKQKFDLWLGINYAFINGLELQYRNIMPKIIAEQYIVDTNDDLKDYKFLCFNDEVYFCWVDIGRFSDHRRNIYDLNWKLQEWEFNNYKNSDYPIEKPKNFELMIELVRKLCRGFSHVRVDLFNVNGKIYFGEMTFTNASGFGIIHPYKYNKMLGDLWKLPI